MHRGWGFDPQSGHIQGSAGECVNKWGTKSMFPSLSLKSINKKNWKIKKTAFCELWESTPQTPSPLASWSWTPSPHHCEKWIPVVHKTPSPWCVCYSRLRRLRQGRKLEFGGSPLPFSVAFPMSVRFCFSRALLTGFPVRSHEACALCACAATPEGAFRFHPPYIASASSCQSL